MHRALVSAAVFPLALAGPAVAEVPSVAVDIAPVHSLVSRVMEGVGTPDLIVQPGASPHGYSLRPSDAGALQRADVVFWIGEELSPRMKDSIDSLASAARSVELMEIEGTTRRDFREGATFEEHSHDHADHDHDHAHDDHSHDHSHDHTHHDHDHDDHGHGHHDHDHAHHSHDHAHDGQDPHAWLDPENARVWLDAIAANLANLDPENADTYRANAAEGREELESLIGEVDAELDSFRGANFIVFHDAYQYFENRFGIPAAGSIRLGDASDPSPARIANIREKVAELEISCVFSEPQFNPGMVEAVFQGTEATVGVLDPLGSDLSLGPDLYPQLLRNLTANLTSCL